MNIYSRRQGSVSAKITSLVLLLVMNLVPASPVLAQTSDPGSEQSLQTRDSASPQGVSDTGTTGAPQTDSSAQPDINVTASLGTDVVVPGSETESTGQAIPSALPLQTGAEIPVASGRAVGPDTAFSSPEVLAKYTPEQRANAAKFDINPVAAASIAANKWLNSYEYANHLPQTASVSGAFSYDVSIAIPPGRNGVQPDLKLSYNSQDRDNNSQVGMGWTLGIPKIERINKSGLDAMYSGYAFRSSLDGEFSTSTATTTSTYRARFDEGSMRLYTLSTTTNTWTMTDKSGTTYVFGSGNSTRVYDSANVSHVAVWMLEKVTDTNGNRMDFTYTKDGSQIYPATITYTANGTTSAPFEIDFVLGNRPFTYHSWSTGFEIQTAKHITEIDIKVNGALSGKYVLSYGTGFNTVRDLLQSVVFTGYDESSGSVTQGPTSFTYQTQTTTWATTTPSNTPPAFVDSTGRDTGYRFFHWRRSSPTTAIRSASFSKSGYDAPNWDTASLSNFPDLVDNSNNDIGSALVDVNGDGFPDIVQGKTSAYHEVYIWNNTLYTSASTSMTNLPDLIDANGNDTGIRFGDFNGDGYTDYIRAIEGLTQYVYLNKADGTGWANGVQIDPNALFSFFVDISGNDTGARVADINGDGIDDVIKYSPADNFPQIWLGQGDGVHYTYEGGFSSGISGVPNIVGTNGKDIGTRLMDIDGDGLTDIVVSTPSRGTHFYINSGDGKVFIERTISSIPYFLGSSDADIGTRIIDANVPGEAADGIPDFVTSNTSTGLDFLSTGKPVDVLTAVTVPDGAVTTATYKGTRVDATLLQTVSSLSTDPGLGQPVIVKNFVYAYGEFRAPYQDRYFAGFARIDTKDSLNNYTITFYHQGNGNNASDPAELWDSASLGEYNDTRAKLYKPYRTEKYSGASSLYDLSISKWDSKDTGNGRALVFLGNALSMQYDGLSSHRDSAVSSDYATTTGNLITKTEWGEVTGSGSGTFSDLSASDNRITTYAYATSTSTSTVPSVIALPYLVTQKDNSGNKVQETRTYYDNQALGSVTLGNTTRQEQWKTSSSYASTTKAYNTFGLPTQSTDGRGNATSFSYDSLNLYVATSTNALGQTAAYTYDYTLGKPKQVKDVNGLITQTIYDGLDRPVLEKIPDLASPSALVTKTAYAYNDTPLSISTQETDYLGTASTSIMYTYMDGQGRTIQTRARSQQSNGNYIVTDKSYDNRGLVSSESLPYFAAGSSRGTATTAPALFRTYSYDALGRTTKVTNAVGSTTSSYANWKVTTNDPDSKTKDVVKDAFGNIALVVEHLNTTYATTTYTWNGLSNLSSLTDAAGNVRNFTYDGLGRQLTAQDLHAPADGTFGTWTYSYDDANNLNQQVDPKNQTTNFAFDVLNRVISEDYTGAGGTEIQYGYDTCAYGKGQLCAATTSAAVTNFAYDANGNTAAVTKTIDGSSYQTAASHDRLGNLVELTYPDMSRVKYGYDTNGYVTELARKAANASAFATAMFAITYAPTGDMVSANLGNGVMSSYTYDPSKLYRLINIKTNRPSSPPGGSGGSLGLAADPFASLAMATDPTVSAFSSSSQIKKATSQLLAVAGGGDASQSSAIVYPSQITLHGTHLSFTNTDDNTGENLIIASDASTYTGISQADVYFSVENTTRSIQHVDLNLYFPNYSQSSVASVRRLAVENTDTPVFSKTCTPVTVASTTKDVSTCDYAVLGTQTITSVRSMSAMPLLAADASELAARIAGLDTTQNVVQNMSTQQTAQDTLLPGERAYYKATVSFAPGTDEKFAIQAVGDAGGYGVLDPWLSSNWSHRKKVTIAGSSGSGANYQVLLKIGESAGVSGAQFDLGGNASMFPSGQGQGGDLRFTASDGSSELNFWVEDVTGNAPNRLAYVWVKVGDDLGSSKDIYVYYGNSQASNASDGYGTFDLFDNFDDGVIDHLKWTTICSTGCDITGGSLSSVSEGGGVLQQTDQSSFGSQSRVVATTTPVSTSGFALDRRFKVTGSGTYSTTNAGFGTNVTSNTDAGTSSPNMVAAHFENWWQLIGTNASSPVISTSSPVVGTWYRTEARRETSQFSAGVLLADDHTFIGATTSTASPAITDTQYPALRSGDGYKSATDWVLMRKYRNPEPSFSSAGAEEDTNEIAPSGVIQNATYTYSSGGDITNITDLSDTHISKTVTYNYDDLHRLVSASTTAAFSNPYLQSYAYDILGNILSKSDVGTYVYGSTGYANPDAPTSVAGVMYSYDNDGNLVTAGPWTYGWDYRNRLVSSGNGSATSTYGYDHTDQRVKQVSGGVTTYYPSKYVSIAGATSTDFIFLGDSLIAEVQSVTAPSVFATTTPAYVQSTSAHAASAVTFPSSVGSGNLVVVGITENGSTIPSNAITDSKGNTYIKAVEAINGSDHAAIFYSANVQGGASFQVNSSVTGTLAVHEYSGVALSGALDQTSTGTGNSKTPSSGNVTTSVGPELYFGLAWSQGNNNSWTAGSGYTLRETEINNTSYERLASEDRVISSPTTVAATFSTSGSKSWAAAVATFKPLVSSSGGSTATTTYYVHRDHLNSTVALTDSQGGVVQALDYYPYGSVRINQAASGSAFDEKHKYIGQYQDDASSLDYLNARYYHSLNGQFLSEDPNFWTKPNLGNPQALNPYSYSLGNPISLSDPSGRDSNQQLLDSLYLQLLQAQVQLFQIQLQQITASTLSTIGNSVNNVIQGYSTAFDSSQSSIDRMSAGTGAVIGTVAGLVAPETRIGATASVGEDALKMMGGGSQVFRSTSLGGRYIDQLVDGVAHEAKVGYSALTQRIQTQIAKDIELLSIKDNGVTNVTWHFFTSPVTGAGGPSGPLMNALVNSGFDVVIH